MSTVTLKIQRFDPERNPRPYWATYQIKVEGTDRLLDALNLVKWEKDGSLTFRRSCAHGVCGSDAMRINGLNRLACKVLMRSVGETVTIQPLPAFRVIKDLVVDLEPFFERYRKIKPYLINDEPPPATERHQSPEQRARYDEGTKCILCACCTGSCPVTWADPEWVGPAALVNAHRFIFDSRDHGAAERLAILSDRLGATRCRTVFNCTECCPRGIPVTGLIADIKRALLYGETTGTE
jgi:succinate dehydrogenase / fumarate reductase iron-sulfur subunit